MKTSGFGRSLKLMQMLTQVGTRELFGGGLNSRISQAKALAKALSELKGAAMKAGQLLSFELNDYFPAEAVEILAQLQNAAQPLDFERVLPVLREDLGSKLEDLKDLARTPVAAASIGQVHRARLREHDVAVKVQYPGVRDSISSDIGILKKVAQSFCLITGRAADLEPLFGEFEIILTQEADYRKEAEFIQRFQSKLEAVPDLAKGLVIPRVEMEYSTPRVLTMSFEAGQTLTNWIDPSRSLVARERIADLLLELFCTEFFKWGMVQTDPNPANYLVKGTTDPKLVLLDFGATREYGHEFRTQYIKLMKAVLSSDRKLIVREAIEFKILDPRDEASSADAFCDMLDVAVEPFVVGIRDKKKFKFRNPDYDKRATETIRKFVATLKYTPPPYQIIFLHRKLGGIFSILKKLDLDLDVAHYLERHV